MISFRTWFIPVALVLSAFQGGSAAAQAGLFGGGGDGVQLARVETGIDELTAMLEQRARDLEDRLDRYQERSVWVLERLQARRAELTQGLADIAEQRGLLSSRSTVEARRLLSELATRSQDILSATRAIEEEISDFMDRLSTAAALARGLRIELEAGEDTAAATVTQATARLTDISARLEALRDSQRELLGVRTELQSALTERMELLDEARAALVESDLAESARLSAADAASAVAVRFSTAISIAARQLSAQIAAAAAVDRRDAMIALLRRSLTPTATQAGGGGATLPSTSAAPQMLEMAHVLLRRQYRPLDAAFRRARYRIESAVALAIGAAGPVAEVPDVDRLRRDRLRLSVLYQERQAELTRHQLESISLQLESLAMRIPVLEHSLETWTTTRHESAAREEGGILSKQENAFGALHIGALWDHSQKILTAPAEAWARLRTALVDPAAEDVGLGELILLLLVAIGAFVLTRAGMRRIRAVTSDTPAKAVALAASRAALRFMPITLVTAVAIAVAIVPPILRPLAWFAMVAPIAVAVVLSTLSTALAISSDRLDRGAARYFKRLAWTTVAAGALLLLLLAALPALGYEPVALHPIKALFYLTLVVAWVGVLVRKASVLKLIGADRDGIDQIGALRAGVRRFYLVLLLLPVAIVAIYIIGYRILAATAFTRGLVVVAVLLLTPWIHDRLHHLAERFSGYPGGGGPFGLSERSALTAYRVVAPAVTLLAGLLGFSLLASAWGQADNGVSNITGAFTYPIVTVGASHVTLLSILFFCVTMALMLVLLRWTLSFLRRRFYLLYEMSAGRQAAVDTLVTYLMVVVGVLVGLRVVGIGLGVFAVFAGIIGIGIGFGSQALASNFISGLILQFSGPIAVGDVIEVEGVLGEVTRIAMATTTVRTPDNVRVIVPNSSIILSPVVNWTKGERHARLHILIGVAYGSDIGRVTALLEEVGRTHPKVRADPPVFVRFEGFGDSSLDFCLLVWVDQPLEAPSIRSQLRYGINESFQKHGVQIPFPQRDLHIRSDDTARPT